MAARLTYFVMVKFAGRRPDNGNFQINIHQHTGTDTYQVCETDSGDCSNEVRVRIREQASAGAVDR
jgi:hypothetical protein